MIVGNSMNVVVVPAFLIDDVLHIFGSNIPFDDSILHGEVSDDRKADVVVLVGVDNSRAAAVVLVSNNSKAAAVVLVSDNRMIFAVRVAVVHSLEE